MGSKIKIIDYNIRYTDDGENRMIADRAPRLEALIRKYEPDVIGLQEASRRWTIIFMMHIRCGISIGMRGALRPPPFCGSGISSIW